MDDGDTARYEPPPAGRQAGSPPPPPSAAPPPPPALPTPPSGSDHGWPAPGVGGPAPYGSPAAPVGWDTTPPSQGNGCLKACLVVGLLLGGLAVVGLILLVVVGGRVAEDPEAFFGGVCPYVTDGELSAAVGESLTAMTLEGFADVTMGALLDKRLLPDAPDCWIVGESGFAARIAVDDGGGAAAFGESRSDALDGGFLGEDLAGLGDEAVCTTISDAGSSGVLVRWQERVVYASVVSDDPFGRDDACGLAATVAATLEP